MNRAERKRLDRVIKAMQVKREYTEEQLLARDQTVREETAKAVERRCIQVMFSLPIKVAHEQLGWTPGECQWFAEAVCDEYSKYLQGNCSEEEVKKYTQLVEDLTGIRFE